MSLMSKFQDDLAAARREKNPPREKTALRQLGRLYARDKEWHRWLACEEQALPLARAVGSPQEVVEILCNLGAAYTNSNQIQRATTCLDEALALARANGLRHHEAAVLGNLARAHSAVDISQGLQTYQDALHIAQENDPHQVLALIPGVLWAARHANQNEQAIIYAKQGVKAARKVQDRGKEGYFLLELGLSLIEQQAHTDAARCLRAARPLLHLNVLAADLARCDAALAQLPAPAATPKITPPAPPGADETLTSPSQRLSKNPRDVLALIGRAESSLSGGDREKALEDITQAEQIIQEEPHLRENRLFSNIVARIESMKARCMPQV